MSKKKLWDLQFAEFLFSNQQWKYPDLDTACMNYGLPRKLDIVKTEFWEKGIDTPDIPVEIMVEYLGGDLISEEALLKKQIELFATTEKSKWRLFLLHMEDQHVLRKMEQNGILYDKETSSRLGASVAGKLVDIERQLNTGYEQVPINWGSGDHLSAYLYGGTIDEAVHIPVGAFKTGAKVGQPRYKIVHYLHELPRLVEPLPKSELKKDGYFATDEKTLKKLRGTREFKKRIGLLDQRSKLEKLRGTYYEGFPKKIDEMGWVDNYLHPNFNQCVAVTGRLSSSNPNGQNQPTESKQLCLSRYPD